MTGFVVWSLKLRQPLSPVFPTRAEARAWWAAFAGSHREVVRRVTVAA